MSRIPTLLLAGALALASVAVTPVSGLAQVAAADSIWSPERPDAVAPAGIFGDRTLPTGRIQVTPFYRRMHSEGVRFGTQLMTEDEVFQFFEVVPLSRLNETVGVDVGYGITEDLTAVGRAGWVSKSRDHVSEAGFFVLESDGLTDVEVAVLWDVWEQGVTRAHLSGGVSIPTGSVDEIGGEDQPRTGPLPYDMQTGAGVFSLIPGGTVKVMNDVGSVGLQVRGHIHLGGNNRGWSPGDALEANGWAQYRLNRFLSVSSGLQATLWETIEGFDEELDPERDPGELPTSFGGERVDLPIGLNLYIPEGVLAGHRMGLEFNFNIHEDLEGPWLAADNGVTFTVTRIF